MNKESTLTIYDCLGPAFWTKRKCLNCQCFFTLLDWEQQNHQLTFKEIGQVKSTTSLNYAVLEGVIVQLTHKSCCSDCISYLQNLKKTSSLKTYALSGYWKNQNSKLCLSRLC